MDTFRKCIDVAVGVAVVIALYSLLSVVAYLAYMFVTGQIEL
jgi:hypothetical protein